MHVAVAGSRVVGTAAARTLLALGASVTVLDDDDGSSAQGRASVLEAEGARVLLGRHALLPPRTDLLVVSPGFTPDSRLVAAAISARVPVWGDVELAVRLRDAKAEAGLPAPDWLCVTGTNGKTTTVRMLESMLRAAGLRTVACGNAGLPLFEAAVGAYDVLAVELSSFQLHYQRFFGGSMRSEAAAVLNLADDHLDWHGNFDAYAADKGQIFTGVRQACVVNAEDLRTCALTDGRLHRDAPVLSFTTAEPLPGQYGVRAGLLIGAEGESLAEADDVRPPGPHNVANALAAAALARSYGVEPAAVRKGLRAFRPDPHRIDRVAEVGGVAYVDDSKATNPAAAAASLHSFEDVVWIAGGLAKGAAFDDLVAGAAGRLRAAVLLGRDRADLARSLARHAPEVPVFEVASGDAGCASGTPGQSEGEAIMHSAVRLAASVAGPASTVLLAPACASMDLFRDYTHRGHAFAAAVAALPDGGSA